MANISTWSTTAANNNATPPDGFPEGQTPSSVNNAARELMAAIRRQHEDAQWIDLGLTHTRTGSDTFTIAGDYTSTYEAGRRVKMTGSATNYGTISASSYSAPDTTVTIAEANVPAALTAVAVGILTNTDSALPGTPSGSFTASVRATSGGSVYGTGTINYQIAGNVVTLWADSAVIGESSSLGTLVITGAPAAIWPSASRAVKCGSIRVTADQGRQGGFTMDTSGVMTFWRDYVSGVAVIANTTFPTLSLSTTGVDAGWTASYVL